MNCKIDTTPDFARDLKQLAKRYPSMKDDYRADTVLRGIEELATENISCHVGVRIICDSHKMS